MYWLKSKFLEQKKYKISKCEFDGFEKPSIAVGKMTQTTPIILYLAE